MIGTVRGAAFLHHLCGVHQKHDALRFKEKKEQTRQKECNVGNSAHV